MTEPAHDRFIVVGVDGSEPSKLALRWAAAQARRTAATLHAVTAWEYPPSYSLGTRFPFEDFEADARKVLAETVEQALGRNRELEVTERVVTGQPAQVLIDAAQSADLLVVGSRGHGGVVGALIGSVSMTCAEHAHCPVLVIRDNPQAGR